MLNSCCSNPLAGAETCELPAPALQRPVRQAAFCDSCGEKGKPVQTQTVKAMLAMSLRAVEDGEYLFCRTPTCPVVYFSADGKQTFTVDQLRERVYQKEPQAEEVLVCYCFRHTVGEIRAASPEEHRFILEDINAGIQAGQCACDLRNPQGSCCLGNVRGLIKQYATAG
jgi:hypothetical protein